MTDAKKENWSSGNLYDDYMGRWSKLIAEQFVTWLDPSTGSTWLDVGCGTGALSHTILKHVEVKSLTGIDPSQDFLDEAKQTIQSSKASFQQGDGTSLTFDGGAFDQIVSALALNFMPDPQQAVNEMARVAKSEGWVALYVWDYAGKMEWLKYFWTAALALDDSASLYDEGQRFPICDPDELRNLFETAKLRDIDVRAIDVPAEFDTFGDYWALFQIGSFPAPAYLKALSADKQAKFKEKLASIVPIHPDGSIHLVTRAWAIRGQKKAML